MNWDAAEKRFDPESVEGRLFSSITFLEKLRAAHRVFMAGADTWLLLTGDDGVLGIGRYYQDEKLAAFFNFSEGERWVNVNTPGVFHDLLTGEAVENGGVLLPPGGFAWLICDFSAE